MKLIVIAALLAASVLGATAPAATHLHTPTGTTVVADASNPQDGDSGWGG
jgi:hypothetical protein